MLRPEVYFSYHTATHSSCMLAHNFLLSLSVAVSWDSSCSNLSNSTLGRCVASSLSFCCCPFLNASLVGSCWTVYSTVYLPLFARPLHHRSSQVHEPPPTPVSGLHGGFVLLLLPLRAEAPWSQNLPVESKHGRLLLHISSSPLIKMTLFTCLPFFKTNSTNQQMGWERKYEATDIVHYHHNKDPSQRRLFVFTLKQNNLSITQH